MIHQTAIVSNKAHIGQDVNIGPYCIIGDDVKIGDGVELMSHVCISGDTTIGNGTKVFPFAAIGYRPQDLKYHGEKNRIIVGKNNSIREYVTIHPGTEGGISETIVGDDNLLMIGVHIAHDCVIGSHIVMGNNATLGGHVIVEDNVIIGGLAAVHQFVRIGAHAMIGGMSGVERDVIPFGAVKGERASLYDLNIIGMQRMNMPRSEILSMKKLYESIFFGNDTLEHNVEYAEKTLESENAFAKHIIDFMKSASHRSFCLPKEHK